MSDQFSEPDDPATWNPPTRAEDVLPQTQWAPPPPPPPPTINGGGYYAPPPYGAPPPVQVSNGLATAAMVCGIVGICLSWVPFVGFILAILAVALGAPGWKRANKGAGSKGQAITGVILGTIVLAISVLVTLAFLSAVGSAAKGVSEGLAALPAPTITSDYTYSPPEATTDAPATDPATGETATDEGTLVVGTDIKPGTYRTTVPSDSFGCYWARLRSLEGLSNQIIANGFEAPDAKITVTIASTDKGFESRDCGKWVKVK